MVNLLPPNTKESYRYARRNVKLRRWVALCLVALVGLGVLATGGLLDLQQSTKHYGTLADTSQQQLDKQDFDTTQQKVQDISNSFKLVVKVLGNEVLFSKLLSQMATAIPTDAYLTNLSIIQGQAGLDVTANATDYTSATQVQVNLADPRNKIFSKADIVSIKCDPASAIDKTHPCTVIVRALFDKNNPFLFISNKAVKP